MSIVAIRPPDTGDATAPIAFFRVRTTIPGRIPVHGSYGRDLRPGMLVLSLGVGPVFVGVSALIALRATHTRGVTDAAPGSDTQPQMG
jgi:hypothetical protein